MCPVQEQDMLSGLVQKLREGSIAYMPNVHIESSVDV